MESLLDQFYNKIKASHMKRKLFTVVTVALLLFSSMAYGQVTMKDVKKAMKTGGLVENAPDIILNEPSFPISALWTAQDSSGTIVKLPLEKLLPITRGNLYYFGRGVERDLDKAVECYALDTVGKSSSWSGQYIKYLKESPYLEIDQKLSSYFVRNLGENNDYIERVVKNDTPVKIKRERALAWATVFFKPEEYKIESSDNSTLLIIKFQYNDAFWTPSILNPGTKKVKELDSGTWYSFGGEIILDFKDNRYRIRIAYPMYSSAYQTMTDRVLNAGTSAKGRKEVIIELMNKSLSNISSCLRYLNGIELSAYGSKRIKEKVFHDNEQNIYDYSNAFFIIMGKYNTIIDSIESTLSKAVDEKLNKDDF